MALKHPDVKLHPVAPAIDLSVVIPLFNEEESVDLAIEELLGVLDGLPLTMEVILVNDGSTDATGEKTRVWHQRDDRVKVVASSAAVDTAAASVAAAAGMIAAIVAIAAARRLAGGVASAGARSAASAPTRR